MSEYENACMAGGHGEAIRGVLAHIGDKWTLLIVGALSVGHRLRRWAMSSYPTILDSREQFDAANSVPKYARSSDL
jgi:DNA-binding HxlR family transcriptional regulator